MDNRSTRRVSFSSEASASNRSALPGEWSSPLCNCHEHVGICLQTLCCGPCTLSNISTAIEAGVPDLDLGACCELLWCDIVSCGIASHATALAQRREIAARYHITKSEGYVASYCINCWCSKCSTCQVQREMYSHGQSAGGLFVNLPPNQQEMHGLVSNWSPRTRHDHSISTDCSSCTGLECLEGFLCLPCVQSYVSSRLEAVPRRPRVGDEPQTAASLSGPVCCVATCAPCAPCYFAFAQRREIVERYQLVGDHFCIGLLLSLFCTPCGVLQMRREMGFRGEYPGGVWVKTAPSRSKTRKESESKDEIEMNGLFSIQTAPKSDTKKYVTV